MSGKTINIKLVKSPIGYNKKQREVLRGMGLRKLNHIVTLKNNESTLGMIKKVNHLVKIVD
jgi:large subunit ribosomal protein L30